MNREWVTVNRARGGLVVILKSLLFGYLGAVLAGLIVGIVGAVVEASPAVVASTASPIGIAAGVLAFSVPWLRPLAARLGRMRAPGPR